MDRYAIACAWFGFALAILAFTLSGASVHPPATPPGLEASR